MKRMAKQSSLRDLLASLGTACVQHTDYRENTLYIKLKENKMGNMQKHSNLHDKSDLPGKKQHHSYNQTQTLNRMARKTLAIHGEHCIGSKLTNHSHHTHQSKMQVIILELCQAVFHTGIDSSQTKIVNFYNFKHDRNNMSIESTVVK